jgi:hypothetical protein
MLEERPSPMTIKLQKSSDFTCPYCNQKVTVGEMADGAMAVAHTMPMCNKFDSLDPAKFIHEAYLTATRNIN